MPKRMLVRTDIPTVFGKLPTKALAITALQDHVDKSFRRFKELFERTELDVLLDEHYKAIMSCFDGMMTAREEDQDGAYESTIGLYEERIQKFYEKCIPVDLKSTRLEVNRYFDDKVEYSNSYSRGLYCGLIGQISGSMVLDESIKKESQGGEEGEVAVVEDPAFASGVAIGLGVRDGLVSRALEGVKQEFRAVSKAVSDLEQEYNKKIGELIASHREQLRLKAPAEHWASRAGEYETKSFWLAIGFGLALFHTILISIFAIIMVATPFALFINWKSDFSLLGSTLLAFVPISLLAWGNQVLLKAYFGAKAIAEDANYRGAIMKSYLTMLADESSPMNESERHLALAALFSPMEQGPAEPRPWSFGIRRE